MGPDQRELQPGTLRFVRSPEAKARLSPALSAGNHDKTMAAPCTVIVAYDTEFYEKLPVLFPHVDARSWFVGKPAHIQATAFRNGTLQGAYLMIAARALGLDVGAMSGLDNQKVDERSSPGTTIHSNSSSPGHGDPAKVHKRNPRPAFDEVCGIDEPRALAAVALAAASPSGCRHRVRRRGRQGAAPADAE